MFDKAALFAALKPKTEPVEVEGFGTVYLKQLSVAEVEKARTVIKKSGADESFGLQLVAMSLVDDSGNLILTDDDLVALKQSSNAAVDKLAGKALEINGFVKAPDTKN